MEEVLRAAKAQGVSRRDAEAALSKLLEELPDIPGTNGETSDFDLTLDFLAIAQNFCQTRYQIWPDD